MVNNVDDAPSWYYQTYECLHKLVFMDTLNGYAPLQTIMADGNVKNVGYHEPVFLAWKITKVVAPDKNNTSKLYVGEIFGFETFGETETVKPFLSEDRLRAVLTSMQWSQNRIVDRVIDGVIVKGKLFENDQSQEIKESISKAH